MTKRLRYVLAAAVIGLVGTGCYYWPVWDAIFDPELSPEGWFVGDGAISIPLPPCRPGGGYTCSSNRPRALWMFGDTLLDYRGTSGQAYMVNNTLAVQNRQDGEPPIEANGEITFWARAWYDDFSVNQFIPWDITRSVPTFDVNRQTHMTGFMLNGDETDPSLNFPLRTFIWGAGGVYLPNDGTTDGKVVLFYEPTRCHGPAATAADYVACRQTYDPPLEFLGERLLTIDNPSAEPQAWVMTTTDIGAVDRFSAGNVPRVRWGGAVLYDDPYVYIYGRPSENDPATRDVDETKQVKVAAATVSTITQYTRWSFLVNDGAGWMRWQAGPPSKVSDLFTVANTGANIFSVDKITYEGKTAYVMVEPIAATTHGVIRTSSSALLWPDFARPWRDPATGQSGAPVNRTDASGNVLAAGRGIFVGNVAAIEPELDGFARDFRAHPELRNHDPATDADATVASNELLISYEVDAFTTQGSFGGGIGKMRFTKWPLDFSYPWCAKGTDGDGDGIGDDVSECKFCGNGVLDGTEDCDPNAPVGQRFDLSRGQDVNGNGQLDCGDVAPKLDVFAKTVDNDPSKVISCTSYCTQDADVCLPQQTCNYDSECGNGQVCACYPSPDHCRCSDKGWTPWQSRDTPNSTGDYEILSDFVNAGQSCAVPTAIACRRKSDGRIWSQTGETLTCDTTTGLSCRNSRQTDGRCDDYEVSFFCAPTRWFNRDSPNSTGDYETLAGLRETNDACDHPVAVECRTLQNGNLVDSSETGEALTCDTTTGLSCRNLSQADRKCEDYEVRFYCGL